MQAAALTVVVPTRNEERNLPRFLASLPRELPLIVVDASTDRTAELAVARRPDHTLVIRCGCAIAEARQIGAEAARTEWVLFTDADVVFPPTFFLRLARQLRDADCVYGSKLSRDTYRRYYRAFSQGQRLLDSLGIPSATGSNLALRRRVLLHVGGFDRQLVCNEDSELVWRVKRAGFRTRFAADTPVYATDHRRLRRGRLRKTAHSLLRCMLLYADLLPPAWRASDWGYWSRQRTD
ncbi:glycosyltransferase [Methylotetracoccus oryzae]|uniref:glycosyltransferase n=1 Tax=Methylotetracoccus oryzae TaxID=1919059 RepID=UPI0011192FB2|nr:glycosyltransferase [Methylotetracoccus oryzae]